MKSELSWLQLKIQLELVMKSKGILLYHFIELDTELLFFMVIIITSGDGSHVVVGLY